jgi:outer membrane protein OmpA-like peptidoglycan-associated protein
MISYRKCVVVGMICLHPMLGSCSDTPSPLTNDSARRHFRESRSYVVTAHGLAVPETPWWLSPPSASPSPPGPRKPPVPSSVSFAGDVLFGVDESTLSDAAASQLNILLERIRVAGATKITIVGHTDSDGTASHNHQLSRGRAESVAVWLAGHGVDPKIIEADGRGESDPLVPNDTAEDKALNRRVVVTVHP